MDDLIDINNFMTGKQYKHRNGNIYTVLFLTNIHTSIELIESHPVDVIYIGQNGRLWSKRLSDWNKSFTIYEGV